MMVNLDARNLKDPGFFRELERQVGASRQVMSTWGAAVQRQAARNARAKGGTFWTSLADAVQTREVSDTGAVVACGPVDSLIGRIGAQKQFGGPIVSKGKKLTIPVSGSVAKGKCAGDFGKLFVVKGEKNALLGRTGADGRFEALFTLVHKTKPQRAFPWWPTDAEILRLGQKEADWWLRKNAQ